VLDGAGVIEDRLDIDGHTIGLRLSAGAFFQTNREVATLAYAAIAEALAPGPRDVVVDAYSGVGAIALRLARTAGEVIGVESHAGAVADATASAAANDVAKARFVAGDAAAALAAIPRADLVVVNPPRKGCAPAVLAELVRLAPRRIAYLSCDPDTLARDLAALVARGRRVTHVVPYDMLPHTPHIESLTIVD
jgi:23S rRNA (uracil1939-C5)-methyltransferase